MQNNGYLGRRFNLFFRFQMVNWLWAVRLEWFSQVNIGMSVLKWKLTYLTHSVHWDLSLSMFKLNVKRTVIWELAFFSWSRKSVGVPRKCVGCVKNTCYFLAVLSIMLYIDEDYKIEMADTARKTTQEQIQKGEAGL